MAQRLCDKCGETVDEAKAFCPACGDAFVAESQRAEPSAFESMDGTMQFGKTMYNEMLSDMGLNIGAKPERSANVADQGSHIPQPAVPSPALTVQPVVQAKKPGTNKWLIVALVVLAALLLLVIAIFVVAFIVSRS